ncbi:MAG: 1,3-beta-glucanase [Actinobacteria bacterium]|nr:1,3-beta-glucanase [Actinomycetota bacterium]
MVALLLGLLVTGCVGPGHPLPGGSRASAVSVLGDETVGPLVDGLTQRTVKELPATRLAAGLTPPTNRWYSGLVFGDEPQPVFPLPLSFALTPDGFGLGLPVVTATADTIAGGYVADVVVGVGAERALVSSDDPSVVVIDQVDGQGSLIGQTTIAQGSPFVTWSAARAATLTIPEGFEPAGDGLYVATLGTARYALATTDATLDGTSVEVAAAGSVVFWPVPEGREPAELAGDARHRVTGSEVRYEVGEDQVSTTLAYAADGETAIARLPHQASDQVCDLGSYPSIYGRLELCAGPELTWRTPRTPARAALELSGLDTAAVAELTKQLDADLAGLPELPADTYFGGKALQRTAMLLMVADQLGLDDRAGRLASVLDEALTRWTESQGCAEREAFCFVYDPAGKGVVGLTPSFGSEEYNDHHFHYGYFLYAAAVMAQHDPSVVERYAPVVDLLAADIGSAGGSHFPDRRAFDVYASHSWASGTSPFADGNNQESVSEAVNAYAGLELWAQAIGDQALEAHAAWMLSLEAHSGAAYWLEPDLSQFPGYGHGITVLNWGGKRDYATWFSPEPAAKLGILLLPMSPTSTYLAGDPERIRANVAEGVGGRFDRAFGDYILMYSALAGPEDAARALALADGAVVDDGMTRTYLLAWLYSLTV